jgi:hypothetical protein
MNKFDKAADKAVKLAEEHWNYVESVLATSGHTEENIKLIGFHYKSAFVHGYKHGRQDGEVE